MVKSYSKNSGIISLFNELPLHVLDIKLYDLLQINYQKRNSMMILQRSCISLSRSFVCVGQLMLRQGIYRS